MTVCTELSLAIGLETHMGIEENVKEMMKKKHIFSFNLKSECFVGT